MSEQITRLGPDIDGSSIGKFVGLVVWSKAIELIADFQKLPHSFCVRPISLILLSSSCERAKSQAVDLVGDWAELNHPHD